MKLALDTSYVNRSSQHTRISWFSGTSFEVIRSPMVWRLIEEHKWREELREAGAGETAIAVRFSNNLVSLS